MFEVKAKDGVTLHTKDKCDYNGEEVVVTAIFSKEEVQVVAKTGTARTIHPAELKVLDSFISRLEQMETDEELLTLLEEAKQNAGIGKKGKKKKEAEIESL